MMQYIIAIVFFLIGWSFRQVELDIKKTIVMLITICGPLTAIWFIYEIFDWPISAKEFFWPFKFFWIPMLVGNLIGQAAINK